MTDTPGTRDANASKKRTRIEVRVSNLLEPFSILYLIAGVVRGGRFDSVGWVLEPGSVITPESTEGMFIHTQDLKG